MSTYQGHLNDGSSVQKHSAGPLYPYIIFAQQRGDALRYGVLAPTGEWIDVGHHDNAVRLAQIMKADAAAAKAKTYTYDEYVASLTH